MGIYSSRACGSMIPGEKTKQQIHASTYFFNIISHIYNGIIPNHTNKIVMMIDLCAVQNDGVEIHNTDGAEVLSAASSTPICSSVNSVCGSTRKYLHLSINPYSALTKSPSERQCRYLEDTEIQTTTSLIVFVLDFLLAGHM